MARRLPARLLASVAFGAALFASSLALAAPVTTHATSVSADVDRDGDLDVIALIDRALTLWINDGAGHLTSQPAAHPSSGGQGWTSSWVSGDIDADCDDGVPDDAPCAEAHAYECQSPLRTVEGVDTARDSSMPASVSLTGRPTRGPPSLS